MKNKITATFYNFNEDTLIEIICALNNFHDSTFIIEPQKSKNLSNEALREILYDWEMDLYHWIDSNYISPSPFNFLRIIPTSSSLFIKINCINQKPYKLSTTIESYYSGIYIKDNTKETKRHANTKEILSMKQFRLWNEKLNNNNYVEYTFYK